MVRVLVVEDDRDNRDLVTSILHFYGYETLRAINGQQAVEVAQSGTPDLILMDISMPIKNGLAASREIRAISRLAAVPIVAMSAYDAPEDQKAAYDAGCVAFLAKPLELFRLKEQIDAVLAQCPSAV